MSNGGRCSCVRWHKLSSRFLVGVFRKLVLFIEFICPYLDLGCLSVTLTSKRAASKKTNSKIYISKVCLHSFLVYYWMSDILKTATSNINSSFLQVCYIRASNFFYVIISEQPYPTSGNSAYNCSLIITKSLH